MTIEESPTRHYDGWGGRVGKTVEESTSWWPPIPTPSSDAPNVIVVLLDDMGFSDIGPFGAEVSTPTLDRLAREGLRYTNYHTTPVCSPARAAFLTGLNPHRAGFASVANSDPGFPGYTMEIAEDVPTLAVTLRDAGYATFCVGKWHLTRDAVMNDAGARRSWPCQQGFDRYYGVLEGLTNLHHPHRLISDNSPVDVDDYPPGYYLPDDITDHAIAMIKGLRASDAHKPFFCYVAHNAVHGPLQAKPEQIAKYRGHYDAGWDELRERRFARQKETGLFDDDVQMAERNAEAFLDVGAWDELDDATRAVFARYMEVYAASIESVDENLGDFSMPSTNSASSRTRSSSSCPITVVPPRAANTAREATSNSSSTVCAFRPIGRATSRETSTSSVDLERWCTTREVGAWRRTPPFVSTRDSLTPAGYGYRSCSVGPRGSRRVLAAKSDASINT